MAGQVFVPYNDTDNPDIKYNDTMLDEIYYNDEQVYAKRADLTLPQYTSTINLRAFINANNPDNRTRLTVTNNLTQPTLITGDLIGLEITLINNGEFQGTVAGNTGMQLTTPIRVNNTSGWIRGAGGDGKDGAAGSAGRQGTASGSKTVYYSVPAYPAGGQLCIINFNGSHVSNSPVVFKIPDNSIPAVSFPGFTVTSHSSSAVVTGPCGSKTLVDNGGGSTGTSDPTNVCGTSFVWKATFGMAWLEYAGGNGGTAPGSSGSHTISGHAGGTAGTAGTPGPGGKGQHFRNPATKGVDGGTGGNGGSGGRYTWKDPNGKTWYGNRSTDGTDGTDGHKGGDGGNWAQRGGLNGDYPGNALIGSAHLLPGSTVDASNTTGAIQ